MSAEQVLVVPSATAAAAIAHAAGRQTVTPGFLRSTDDVLSILHTDARFIPRKEAETDPSYKQLIVYAMVTHQGKILRYKRGKVGGEARLHAQHSVGVGGHINPEDWPENSTTDDSFYTALLRELGEEAGIAPKHIRCADFVGMVNEDATDVGRVHLGLVYRVELASLDGLVFEESFVEPKWVSRGLLDRDDNLELWSVMIKEACLLPHQVRVLREYEELEARVTKLTAFTGWDAVTKEEQGLMTKQLHFMREYRDVLAARIALF